MCCVGVAARRCYFLSLGISLLLFLVEQNIQKHGRRDLTSHIRQREVQTTGNLECGYFYSAFQWTITKHIRPFKKSKASPKIQEHFLCSFQKFILIQGRKQLVCRLKWLFMCRGQYEVTVLMSARCFCLLFCVCASVCVSALIGGTSPLREPWHLSSRGRHFSMQDFSLHKLCSWRSAKGQFCGNFCPTFQLR